MLSVTFPLFYVYPAFLDEVIYNFTEYLIGHQTSLIAGPKAPEREQLFVGKIRLSQRLRLRLVPPPFSQSPWIILWTVVAHVSSRLNMGVTSQTLPLFAKLFQRCCKKSQRYHE